jgi:hypothetical protein
VRTKINFVLPKAIWSPKFLLEKNRTDDHASRFPIVDYFHNFIVLSPLPDAKIPFPSGLKAIDRM